MERPYKIRHGRFVGTVSCILTGLMVLLYLIPIPFSNSMLSPEEWGILAVWILLGMILYVVKRKNDKKIL